MKFLAVATSAVLALSASTIMADVVVKPDAIAVISPKEAFEAVKMTDLPAGVTLTGVTEPIKQPTSMMTKHSGESKDQKEWLGGYGWGVGGWPGLGWGGWGGFGPYRFGYACGGLSGWAYPLGFWNTWGAGLYGGGCGLGYAYGGLFYC